MDVPFSGTDAALVTPPAFHTVMDAQGWGDVLASISSFSKDFVPSPVLTCGRLDLLPQTNQEMTLESNIQTIQGGTHELARKIRFTEKNV